MTLHVRPICVTDFLFATYVSAATAAFRDYCVVYLQVAQPMQPEGQEGFADVQLLQIELHHTSEDNALQNLQQYGNYTVVSPVESSAMQSAYISPDSSHSAHDNSHSTGDHDSGNNSGAMVKWYGCRDDPAAVHHGDFTHEDHMGHAPWNSQQAVHYTAVAKKAAPGDVSRHDTPTSVFDIFNALSIVHPISPRGHMNQQATGNYCQRNAWW